MENETKPKAHFKCFVPYCGNESNMVKRPLRFFQIPNGVEGLYWKKAVNVCRRRQYERMIELLTSKKQLNVKSLQDRAEYCCEVHFDVSRSKKL